MEAVGLITYLRTDSTRVSETAEAQVKEFIEGNYGDDYMATEIVSKKSSKKIQDAHEAIRPTDVSLTPDMVKAQLPRDHVQTLSVDLEKICCKQNEKCSL